MAEKTYGFEFKGVKVTDSGGNVLLDTGSIAWPTLQYGEVVAMQKAIVAFLNKTVAWGEEAAKIRNSVVPL